MFQNNLVKNNLKNISIKELYILYSLFVSQKHSNTLKITIKTLCKSIFFINTLFSFEKNPIFLKRDVIFLNIFFFRKTRCTSSTFLKLQESIVTVSTKKLLPAKSNLLTKKLVLRNFSIFWEKWKNLKRPKTEEKFNTYLITLWESRMQNYINLNFIKDIDVLYTIRVKTDTFNKKLVTFNKKLLSIPKYSSSSISKIVSLDNSKNFEFQFLRKNKIYNKGRYSRCRQNYRTGVYMCMYLSVVSIFGLYYWFYKFSFNFTYLWWLFIGFLGSFFLPKIIKYRLYEPTTLFSKLFDFFRWLLLVIRSLFFKS